MTDPETEAIVEGVVAAVLDHVRRDIAPIVARVGGVELRLGAIERKASAAARKLPVVAARRHLPVVRAKRKL